MTDFSLILWKEMHATLIHHAKYLVSFEMPWQHNQPFSVMSHCLTVSVAVCSVATGSLTVKQCAKDELFCCHPVSRLQCFTFYRSDSLIKHLKAERQTEMCASSTDTNRSTAFYFSSGTSLHGDDRLEQHITEMFTDVTWTLWQGFFSAAIMGSTVCFDTNINIGTE